MNPLEARRAQEEGRGNDKRGVDALENLAYLIAEMFISETELQVADHLLTDPTVRRLVVEKPKVKKAGSG